MGDILKAIHDDMEEYEGYCKHFKEEVQYSKDFYGNKLVDCYGAHAKELKRRYREEQEAKRKKA